MSELLLIREQLEVADRRFAVYGEPWFDAEREEWCGRVLFLPLDRSLPHAVSTAAARRTRRREPLLDALRGLRDRELRRIAVALIFERSAGT